jgi:DNA-binding transcriptional ArsR family regulator
MTRWQPALIYPTRGVGTLWEPGRIAAPAALSALLGQRRGLSAPSVSQHLAVLRDAGLVNGNRGARTVLYARTPRGPDLLDLGE